MNPKTILLLLTTITFSTAIPFSQQQTPASTPTKQSANPALSSIAPFASVSPKANSGTCPDTHRSKQCCQSIDSIAEGITKPLGQLVPLLDGATVKSILSLDCKAMADTDPNENCTKDVMCCNGQPGDKGSDLFKECESYDKAMKDKQEALEKNKQRPLEMAMSWAAMTSSMLAAASSAAAASSSPGLASSGVHAVPTGN